MKKSLTAIAIALSALAAGATAQASEETYVPATHSTLTRAQVQAEQAAAADTAQATEQTYVPASHSTRSRAQVRADLAAWHDAGLADEWRGNLTPDIDSIRYRGKVAAYRQFLVQQTSGHSLAAQ